MRLRVLRAITVTVAVVVAFSALSARAQSDVYPNRSVRMVVPAGPGSSPDILARTIAHHLGPRLGQQIIVINQPGGASNIGHATAAKSEPDGYTLLVTSDALSINDTLFPNQALRSTDFTPVIHAISAAQVLVIHAGLPVKDVPGLIAYARANPGRVNFGSPQPGTLGHLTGELMKMSERLDIVHVPFKGAPLATADLIAGNIHMLWVTLPAVIGHMQQSRIRALAVSSARRSRATPDVPTMRELGFNGYDFDTWQGVLLPANAPVAVVNRLNSEINAVLKMPAAIEALARIGFDPIGGSPEQFRAVIAETAQRWGKVVREAGVAVN